MQDETLWEQVRALPGTVWILFIGLFIHRFGTFVIPFLTLYLTDLGYTTSAIGAVFASLACGGIGAMILGGRLADLLGRKNTMTISLLGSALSMIFMWQADSFWQFIVATFVTGLTSGMYHPASNSLLTDVVPPDRRITAFATVRWAVNLGFAGGMAAGGFLADRNFAWLFIGDAVSSVIFAVIAFQTLPHGIRTGKNESRWIPAIQNILRNRRFVAFFFANFAAVMAFFHWGSSLAKFTVDLGYTKQDYGWIMALNGVMIALFEIAISQVARRRHAPRVIALGFFLCGAGVWIAGFAAGWQLIVAGLVVFTLGEMIALPVAAAYVAELAPKKMRGRYTATIGLTWNIGQGVTPWLGLFLYQQMPLLLWWGSLGLGILSAVLVLAPSWKQKNRKDLS